jgi:hypothetical protein
MLTRRRLIGLTMAVVGLLAVVFSAACNSPASTSPSPTTSPTPTATSTTPGPTQTYSQYQLAYLLLDKYPDFFWCDPDFYPIAREGGEQANALSQFSSIRSNSEEFSAILTRLNLPVQTDYSDSQKLAIYREHKKLTRAIQLTAAPGGFQFNLAVGEGQGQRITGNISVSGQISGLTAQSSFNTCPICLSLGTLIDTPAGPVPVEQIQPGDLVWSLDARGEKVAVPVLRTSRTAVPPGFQMLRFALEDGRTFMASPNHPDLQGRALGDYRVGQLLDGSKIVAKEWVDYEAGFTFDLLPDSLSAAYWAQGILVGSTLQP